MATRLTRQMIRISDLHGRLPIPRFLEVVQDADDVGKFDFHLRGLKVGETTIELQVTHDDHVDFRTIPIPVHVGE